jgi:hypothetical protein
MRFVSNVASQRQERIAIEELGLKREALTMQKKQADLPCGMVRDERQCPKMQIVGRRGRQALARAGRVSLWPTVASQ